MNASVDTRGLKAALAAWGNNTRIDAEKEMRIQARVLSMRLMENTQPSPLIRQNNSGAPVGQKAKKAFNDSLQASAEMKISRDIEKVYDTIPEAAARIKFAPLPQGRTRTQNREQAAKVFIGLLKGKVYRKKQASVVQAEALLERLNVEPLIRTKVGPFDEGQAHQSARFGPKQRVPRNQYVRTVVTNPGALEKYIDRRMTKAGIVKAAWAECAQQLGGTQTVRSGGSGGWANTVVLPKWVKRHVGTYGKGRVTEAMQSDKPYIEVKNAVSYVGENISAQTIQETVANQVLRLINRLGYITRSAARKAGL